MINRVIAHNLAAARRLRGLTQAEAVERINHFLTSDGWSANTLSLAESGAGGKRWRHFTVEQLVAFAQAYDVPLGYFLLPIQHPSDDGLSVELESPIGPKVLAALLDTRANPAVRDRVAWIRRWAANRDDPGWRYLAERLGERDRSLDRRREDLDEDGELSKRIEDAIRRHVTRLVQTMDAEGIWPFPQPEDSGENEERPTRAR